MVWENNKRSAVTLLMPLPGSTTAARAAMEAASLRAYWHAFVGGDAFLQCLEAAAALSEQEALQVGCLVCYRTCP